MRNKRAVEDFCCLDKRRLKVGGSVLSNLEDQLRFNKLTDSITWNYDTLKLNIFIAERKLSR